MHVRLTQLAGRWRHHRSGPTRRRATGAIAAGLVAAAVTVTPVAVTPAVAAPATEVLAWGSNVAHQLGDATRTDRPTPVNVQLPAGTTVTGVAAGCRHSLAATSDGLALAWGDNSWGQLGDGTTTSRNRATQVDIPAGYGGLTSGTLVTAVAGGCRHSLALTDQGWPFAWGSNDHGQLGDGSTTQRTTPVPVDLRGLPLSPFRPISAVAAGDSHSLAITVNGRLLAWGLNDSGQLGNGSYTDSSRPVWVSLPDGVTVTDVAAGAAHTLAVTDDGQVLAWGTNVEGELGGYSGDRSNVPVPVSLPDGVTVTDVAAGTYHSLARTSDGRVLAWGFNTNGQLGDGSAPGEITSVPVWVSLPAAATAADVAARAELSLAMTADGRALAWGSNSYGQLGDGSTSDSLVPVWVSLPGGTTIAAIAAGGDPSGDAMHAVALPANPAATTIRLAAAPTRAPTGTPVTLTATVTCPAGASAGTVTFVEGTNELTTTQVDDGVASHVTAGLATGTYRFIARYSGHPECAASVSPPLTVTIT